MQKRNKREKAKKKKKQEKARKRKKKKKENAVCDGKCVGKKIDKKDIFRYSDKSWAKIT